MIGVRGRGNFTTENKKGTEKERPETRGLRFSRMAMGKRIRLLTGDVALRRLLFLCILFPGLAPWASFWRAYGADKRCRRIGYLLTRNSQTLRRVPSLPDARRCPHRA